MLNPLIREVDDQFALGDGSHALLAELLTLVFDGRSGGVPGLVGKFHRQGLGLLIESWLSDGPQRPIKPWQLERIFESGKLSAMANRLGVVRATATAAACLSLPGLIRLLTRGGRRPIHLPGDVSRYLGSAYTSDQEPASDRRPENPFDVDGWENVRLTPRLGWVIWMALTICLIAFGFGLLRRQPAPNEPAPSHVKIAPDSPSAIRTAP